MASLHDNAYYRARIQSLRDYAELSAGKKKFYQNGLVPKSERANFDKYVDKHTIEYDTSPLTFTELMTYNTWYEKHKEKVAGTMVGSSSFYFPVLVKGTKKDVENMFKAAPKEQENELEMLELEAEALALELEMSKDKLSGTEDYTPYYEFIKTAISSNSHKRIDCTSLLSKHSLDSVKRLLNREISKFYLTANDLRHIINRHSGRQEFENGQIPITVEDLLRIPEILSRPTSIELGSYDYKNGFSIKFTRNYVDGKQYCVLVEVYESGRTALAVKTGYKKPLSGSLNGYVPPLHGIDALQTTAPKHNVRNARAVPMLCANITNFFRTR